MPGLAYAETAAEMLLGLNPALKTQPLCSPLHLLGKGDGCFETAEVYLRLVLRKSGTLWG